jgi:UPF0755 protein
VRQWVKVLEEFEVKEEKSRRNAVTVAVAIGVLFALIAGSFFALRGPIEQAMDSLISRFTVEDYPGPGTGSVTIIIEQGDNGEDVARKLLAADVIKSFDAIYRPMLQSDLVIYPGHYEFPMQISGAEALRLLLAGENRVTRSVTIPEGYQIAQIIPLLQAELGIAQEELVSAIDAANDDYPGPTLEGFLFPATYKFDPGVSATEVIGAMLTKTDEVLSKLGVSREESLELLTLASIIQEEAKLENDFYKVATVFHNRIDKGMLLQTDPTVKYYYEGSIDSFQQGVADAKNPYNTYVYPGLPPGPISSPGELAIDAAKNPAPGDYLFFVTINLRTGETVFSETLREHERAVELYRKWLRENPGWG